MKVRQYDAADCSIVAELFFHTVHTVNAKDYSPAQLAVWATGHVDLSSWNESLSKHYTIIAEIEGNIVGFGDMDEAGYLDRLYVHTNYQRQGIASAILDRLEQYVIAQGLSNITTQASITAKEFFQSKGYHVVCKHQVVRDHIALKNFMMEKKIHAGNLKSEEKEHL